MERGESEAKGVGGSESEKKREKEERKKREREREGLKGERRRYEKTDFKPVMAKMWEQEKE